MNKASTGRKAPIKKGSSAPKPSQTDEALSLIRSRIIDLSLAPGSRIDEPLLIEKFRLGRTPAREAINRLVAEGLVKIAPNRGGTYVRGLDFAEIGEVVAAQQLVESMVAQLCNLNDPTLIPDLEAIQEEYVVQVRQRAYLEITSLNERFHLRMHRSVGNSFFFEFAQSTHRHVRRLLVLIYRMEESDDRALEAEMAANLEEHREVIRAIRSKNRPQLRELLQAHARQSQNRLLRLLSSRAIEPFSLDLHPVEFPGKPPVA